MSKLNIMKTLLLAAAFATASASAHAAIIQYEFASGDMPLISYADFRGSDCGNSGGANDPWRYGESENCKWVDGVKYVDENTPLKENLGAYMIIDTSKVVGNRAWIVDSERGPLPYAYSAGVLEGTYVDPITNFGLTFDADWNVSAFSLDFDSDGTGWRGDENGSYLSIYSLYQAQLGYGLARPGTWTKTVLTPDTPAPVPLPAAGFLLMSALAGFGVMTRRNKAG